jgi:anti-sigma regulatory factor (Ser/Thr protein kinase)
LGVRPGAIENAELVLAEMVGNAIRHARPLPGGTLTAGWEVAGDRVMLRVTDGGSSTRPTIRRRVDLTEPERERERGRGMAIVAALAVDWGAEPAGVGLQTWAVVDLR